MPLDLSQELLKRAVEQAVNQDQQGPQFPMQGQPPTPAPQPQRSKGWRNAATAAYFGGVGADLGSTAYFLAQPGGDLYERNPLVNWAGEKGVLPLAGGMTALGYLLAEKALKNHPKLRNALGFGLGALHTGFAIDNVRAVNKLKRTR